MADESPIQNDNYTAKSVILVSRNQNEPLPVQLQDGKAIVGDSSANSGVAQVEVPVPDGDETHFLNGAGEWVEASGGATGYPDPAEAADNTVLQVFDGTATFDAITSEMTAAQGYSPAVNGDWPSVPDTVAEALDELAAEIVPQQAWTATMSQTVDLNEVTTSAIFDWTGAHAVGVPNSLSESVVPSWIVNDDGTPTLVHLDNGAYIVSVSATFVQQDSLEGATSVDGLTGESSISVERAAGGATGIAVVTLIADNTRWDPSNAILQQNSLYLVSIPSSVARQKFKVEASINVTDPTFFVQATANMSITRIG